MISTNPRLHEWAKQLAIWLSITSLLPLVAWFGTSLVWQQPDAEEHMRSAARLNERLGATTNEAEKNKLRQQIDQDEQNFQAADKAFERKLFWVAAPVGLLALIGGTFVRVQAVGAGLMFGGIGSLSTGCFESWESLGPKVRLAALLLSLIVSITLGMIRFRSSERLTSLHTPTPLRCA